MTSSNGNIFRVTSLLCRDFSGHRWSENTPHKESITRKKLPWWRHHVEAWWRIYGAANWVIIGDNVSPVRYQDIIWTNADVLSTGRSWTNFTAMFIKIQCFYHMKIHMKISSAKSRPFCSGFNALTILDELADPLMGYWSCCYQTRQYCNGLQFIYANV